MPTQWYVIEATDGHDGVSALWWKPDRCGYTTNLNDAGLYSEADARVIEHIRGTDRAWRYEDANIAAETVITSRVTQRAAAARYKPAFPGLSPRDTEEGSR
jgi:hypothetical protein